MPAPTMGMRLRVVIEWENGVPVLLPTGQPLAYTEVEFAEVVGRVATAAEAASENWPRLRLANHPEVTAHVGASAARAAKAAIQLLKDQTVRVVHNEQPPLIPTEPLPSDPSVP